VNHHPEVSDSPCGCDTVALWREEQESVPPRARPLRLLCSSLAYPWPFPDLPLASASLSCPEHCASNRHPHPCATAGLRKPVASNPGRATRGSLCPPRPPPPPPLAVPALRLSPSPCTHKPRSRLLPRRGWWRWQDLEGVESRVICPYMVIRVRVWLQQAWRE
jgi:hypothetical protein